MTSSQKNIGWLVGLVIIVILVWSLMAIANMPIADKNDNNDQAQNQEDADANSASGVNSSSNFSDDEATLDKDANAIDFNSDFSGSDL